MFIASKQHRNQLVILRDQGLVCIDIHYLNGKSEFVPERLQGNEHVVTKVAIATGVENEMNQGQ